MWSVQVGSDNRSHPSKSKSGLAWDPVAGIRSVGAPDQEQHFWGRVNSCPDTRRSKIHRSFDLRLVAPLPRATLRMTRLKDVKEIASLKAHPPRFSPTLELYHV